MKGYEKIEDFLEDKSFKQWVLKGDGEQGRYWQEWLHANPSKTELLGQAKTILLELDASTSQWTKSEKEGTYLAIKTKIRLHEEKAGNPNPYVYTSANVGMENRVRVLLGAVLLIVFSLALYFTFLPTQIEGQLAQDNKRKEWIIKSNPKGQKSTLHLADGSNVVLNAESELRFNREFGQVHREIYLSGEAFFEVASDSLLPFRVHSGDLITIALGTSFNITSYNEDRVQVKLATGKVRVTTASAENQSVELVPGEEAVIDRNSQLVKGKFNLEKAFHWKEGILVFEKMPFQEVVHSLERWYAADIKVQNMPSNALNISAEFKKNTYLKDVLESLGYAYNFDFSIKNKEVNIQFK